MTIRARRYNKHPMNGLTPGNCNEIFSADLNSLDKSHQRDYNAISKWLSEYRAKKTTIRAYQKESDRFLLWVIIQLKKNLKDVTREDFDVYFRFIQNPLPKEMWCAPKGGRSRSRGDVNWRPFVGPLSPSGQRLCMAALNSMMSYLVDSRYLDFNPLILMRKKSTLSGSVSSKKIDVQERILEDTEWQAILKALSAYPESNSRERDEKYRLEFLVKILYFLGIRISELESHKWNSFRSVEGKWWFFVLGKGDKLAKIPVNDPLLSAIQTFRKYLGVDPLPNSADEKPIIPSWSHPNGLSSRHMSNLIKELGIQASSYFDTVSLSHSKLRAFSPHWIRHLSASHQDRAGVSFKHIKANHRHAADETTRLYVHAMDDERHEDMQRLRWNQPEK